MHKAFDDRADSVILRSIGALAIASCELRNVRPAEPSAVVGSEEWDRFAVNLLASSDAVIAGACGRHFPGNTISILRDGVRVAVDAEHVQTLVEKIRRHTQVGIAFGLNATSDRDLVTA